MIVAEDCEEDFETSEDGGREDGGAADAHVKGTYLI